MILLPLLLLSLLGYSSLLLLLQKTVSKRPEETTPDMGVGCWKHILGPISQPGPSSSQPSATLLSPSASLGTSRLSSY